MKDDTEKATEVDHGAKLKITEADEKAAEGDQTPLQMRNTSEDDLPDPDKHYVVSGIDPAHVQQPETEDNAPKGTLPGV